MNPNEEINEDHPNENKQRLSIQSLLYSKGVGHHHLCLAETPRQARDWGCFTMGKKEGFRQGGFWHEDVEGG